MTLEQSSPRDLSDGDILTELERAASSERDATARLVALLTEVDCRRLYAGQGFSSLFTYCVRVLHLSEHAAYLRIEAARAVRRFPAILDALSDGSLHLTAISMLASHLTTMNHVEIIDSARHKTKRELELLIARLRPQPDVPSIVRKLPAPTARVTSETAVVPEQVSPPVASTAIPVTPVPTKPALIKPLAPERYKVQVTVSRETYGKLRRLQELMRHTIPNGDVALIFDRALTLLLDDLLKTKCGATGRPRSAYNQRSRSRHIPSSVKRVVWRRDEGQCAFQGQRGRCTETAFLEFHHLVPYADGGETTVSNIQLRCRSHNRYEADLWSGETQIPRARETSLRFGA